MMQLFLFTLGKSDFTRKVFKFDFCLQVSPEIIEAPVLLQVGMREENNKTPGATHVH